MVFEVIRRPLTSRVVFLDSSLDDDNKTEEVPQIYKSPSPLIRTQLLILDYKQFKAARLIQKVIRGWLVRINLKKRNNAALAIQRAWWRYNGKSFKAFMAQKILQTKIVDTFNISSVKIQSLFRGWHSRKHFNNLRYLNIVQASALEDILRSMVFKMHKLNAQNELPGIMSFHDKDWSKKIESFLSSLSYRLFNCYVKNNSDSIRALREERIKEFKEADTYTNVPFIGYSPDDPYTPSSLDPTPKTYNKKELDVAIAFTKGFDPRTAEDHKRISKLLKHLLQQRLTKQQLFCKDMCSRITNWSSLSNYDREDMDSLLEGTVTEFLDTIKEYLQAGNYMENCNCVRDRKPTDYDEMHR